MYEKEETLRDRLFSDFKILEEPDGVSFLCFSQDS